MDFLLIIEGWKALKEFHKTELNDYCKKFTSYYGEAPSDVFYEAMCVEVLKKAILKLGGIQHLKMYQLKTSK